MFVKLKILIVKIVVLIIYVSHLNN